MFGAIGLLGHVTSPHPDTADVIAPPPVVLAIALAIGFCLQAIVPMSFTSNRSTLIGLVGATLSTAGGVRSAAVWWRFRAGRTPVSPGRPTTRVVRTGPYRYSRNPDYIGQLLVYIGATLVANTWWPIFLAPVVLLVIQRVVQRE